jgi:hypothetical protein
MSLPISLEIYQQLLCASVNSAFKQEAWEIGAVAIREWMTRNNPESFAMPETCGYQWKHLFLPNGTFAADYLQWQEFKKMPSTERVG